MPTVDEITALQELFEAIRIGEPVSHGALTVVPLLAPLLGPLLAPGSAEPDWLTLTEAGDKVTIEEIDEGGSVPTLRLRNGADWPVLLLDGEELVGAKQNRVLNTTVLVAAQATVTIPVSCVEHGRWSYRSRGFVASEHSLYASLRARKVARVSESIRRGDGHTGNQAEIWEDLAAKATFLHASSATDAMNDVFMRFGGALRQAGESLAAQPGQVGALVYLCGRWLGLDALAAPGLFARAWPRLCSGYAADALGREPRVGLRPKPSSVLALLKSVTAVSSPAVGLGAEHRFESKAVHGAALVVEGRVVHAMAFNGDTAR
jgi:hypothetical protein